MATAQDLLATFEAELNNKEQELLVRRMDVRAFVETEHTAKKTLEMKADVSKSEAEVATILRSLLEAQTVLADFKAEASTLCERCRCLNDYTRDMHQALSSDLTERRRAEDQDKVDVIKNATFVVAMPAAFVALLKGGVGEGYVTPIQAAEAGFVFGSSVVFRKKIKSAFQDAAKAICNTPRQIKDSFLLYYVTEAAKQKIRATTETLGQASKKIGTGITSVVSGTMRVRAQAGTVLRICAGSTVTKISEKASSTKSAVVRQARRLGL